MTLGSPAQAATLTSNWYGSAPYVMPLDNNPPDLSAVMAATGQKAFELAFILAPNGGGCSPTWGGTAPVSSDTAVASIISTIRAAGGDVSVSTGGYGGTKLGQVCSSAAATAAAYQQVISKYSLKAIDLDLEEPEYENTTAINNEIGAAQILQQNNPGLYVSITVPGTTSGTGYFGQNVLNTAKADQLHAGELRDHAVRRWLQRRGVADLGAGGVPHAAREHVRLEQRDRVQPRGRVADERPLRHR